MELMAMGVKRIVDTDFWTDSKVLDFTVEDKYFMLYLLTNPQCRQVGIYKLPKKIMSFQTGYTIECITNLIARFRDNYNMIAYNDSTQEIAIKNYLKYSIVSGGKPVIDCIKKDLSLVSDKKLILYIKESLSNIICLNNKPIFLDILNILKDYNYDDIYNDNDNERIVARFVNESSGCVEIPENSLFDSGNKKSKKNKSEIIYQEILDNYNSICLQMPKASKLTETRKKAIKSRLSEFSQEDIIKAFNCISHSTHHNGQNERGWTADFDWIMTPRNFIKILEKADSGGYNSAIPKKNDFKTGALGEDLPDA